LPLTDNAAHLRPVLVYSQQIMSQVGQLEFVTSQIQDIREDVQAFNAVGIEESNLLELSLRFRMFCKKISNMEALVYTQGSYRAD
jgi:hypothetical protein